MKIALIGATGNIGSKILAEALARGHYVTAIARNPESLPPHEKLTVKKADMKDETALASLLSGHDAVISSVHFSATDISSLINAVKKSAVPRYLVVGGAGSLYVAPDVQLVDTAQFPEAYKPEAGKGRDFLNALKAEPALDWTFLSPSAEIAPGSRTGKFRLGLDALLSDENGKSHISQEDYAAAMIDEVEKPAHSRQRFTVGY